MTRPPADWSIYSAGSQGPAGPQGAKGDTGAQGIQGPKGDTGNTGAQGPTGNTGPKGDKGDTGDTGPAGNVANCWPVGSVFLSVVVTNPATLLGFGTWSQIAQGQMLTGQKTGDSDFGTVEGTGGAKTHTHADHAALTHSGGAVGAISGTATSAVKIGTSSANAAAQAHTHPAPTFTQPNQHAAQSHDSPSHLNPYFVVYVWKRTA